MLSSKSLAKQAPAVFTALATLNLLTALPLRAGEITTFNWFSGVASVAGIAVSPPSSPNNDDVIGTSPNNIFVAQKDYVGIGPVDLEFDVINSGGVTEYLVTEGVLNHTGLTWSGYRIQLGFGTGLGFVKSTPGDGLDFDAPNFNSDFFFNPAPGFFPSVTVLADDILASGGVMPDFSYAGNFLFTIDVPDGITSFTIRQAPVPVPEPATLTLLGLGVLVLQCVRRQKGC